jgi:hypothetical protein
MTTWGIESDFFQLGLELDPIGRGASWARIAVAARETSPVDSFECARRAVEANPAAWRAWYDAFTAERRGVAA